MPSSSMMSKGGGGAGNVNGSEKDQIKLASGLSMIQERARSKKYHQKTLDSKVDKYVESKMWNHKQDMLEKAEQVRKQEEHIKNQERRMVAEAEQEAFEDEDSSYRRNAKIAAAQYEKRRKTRWILFLIGFLFFGAGVAASIIIWKVRAQQLETFRTNLASMMYLNEEWEACDDIYGLTMYFSNMTSGCDMSRSKRSYYLYNITNPEEVEAAGAKPIVDEIGPFEFQLGVKKQITSDANGLVQVTYQPYQQYIGDESLLDSSITTINQGYATFLAALAGPKYQLSDSDTILFPDVVVDYLQRNVFGVQASSASEWFDETLSVNNCMTFGCFLREYKFNSIVTKTSGDVTEMDAYFATNMGEYPTMGTETWTDNQTGSVWNMLQSNSGLLEDACDYLQAVCDKFSASTLNAKKILDGFKNTWGYEQTKSPMLTSSDLINLQRTKDNADISYFESAITARDHVCLTYTIKYGSLTCSQLNDIIQYMNWIFDAQWYNNLFKSRSNLGRGFLTTQTARSHLLTGFDDATLAIYNLGIGDSDTLNQTAGFERVQLLSNAHINMMNSADADWLNYGWVEPIVNMPNPDVIPSNGENVFLGTYFAGNSQGAETFQVEYRSFLDGTGYPRYLDRVGYLSSINNRTSNTLWDVASDIKGFSKTQTSPTLDIFLSGDRYQPDGSLAGAVASDASWESSISIWDDLTFRPNVYVEDGTGGLSTDGGVAPTVSPSEIPNYLAMNLRSFKLKYDRFKQYPVDMDGYTCLVNISAIHNGVGFYAGYPNYLTCNSTHGITPETVDSNNGNSGGSDNGFSDGSTATTSGFSEPQKENALPLSLRSDITDSVFQDNTTMNVFLVEPVSGQMVHSSTDIGFYVDMFPTSFLFRDLPTSKLPYYTISETQTITTSEATAFIAALEAAQNQANTYVMLVGIIMPTCVLISMVFCLLARRRPEFKSLKVKPIETIENDAKTRVHTKLEPERDKLRECKSILDGSTTNIQKKREEISAQAREHVIKEILENPDQLNYCLSNTGALVMIPNREIMQKK